VERFLVEFRLHGYAKKYARGLIGEVARKFRRGTRKRAVPHVTLYGQSETGTISRVVSEVERIGRNHALVPCRIKGPVWFIKKNGEKVICLDVEPSPALQNMRWDLAEALRGISVPREYDRQRDFRFHITIADNVTDTEFPRIWRYVKSRERPDMAQHVARVTVLDGRRRIIREYDMVLGRLLDRRQALSSQWLRRTTARLRELQGLPKTETPSIRDRFNLLVRELSGKKCTYFIGDTHFDHANIIRYCNRPFSDVHEMNRFIKDNWNGTVGRNDTVYFLGDWSFGRHSRAPRYWMRQLKGRIVCIRGSHDRDAGCAGFDSQGTLQAPGYEFLMVHDPKDRPPGWQGWTIHGHVHNNDMQNYPFINGERRTINVSAELVNYKPVNLSHLLSLDLCSIRRMATINDEPERPSGRV
jgi:calcineurin-like phosphoesterase family protein/2'-5' RNA ligase